MDCSKTHHFLMGSWSKVSEFIKEIKFAVLNMKNIMVHWRDGSLAFKFPLE